LVLTVPVLAETEAEILTRFETETITFDFKKAGVNEVCEFLHRETRVPFRPSAALQEQVLEGGYRVTAKLKSVPLATALRLLMTTHGLKLAWTDGGFCVRLADEPPEELFRVEIDLRETLIRVHDFEAPEISLSVRTWQSYGLG
jgi:hypothetical protein